jgi:two-component sensor histidine kinase
MLALAMGGLIAAVLAVLQTLSLQDRLAAQYSQTSETIAALEAVRTHLLDVETGQRGYLIIGSDDYLEPFNQGASQLTGSLNTLDALYEARPSAQAGDTRAALREAIMRRLDRAAASIALRRSGDVVAAFGIVQAGDGKEAMDMSRETIDALVAAERASLVSVQARADRMRELLPLILALGTAAALTGFAIAFGRHTSAIRLASEAEQAVQLKEARDRAELLAGELNHRIKNLFAITMSIITATARGETDARRAAAKARDRVQALANAHAITASNESARSAGLAELIETIVGSQRSAGQALNASGPPVAIGPSKVTSVGMILHELTTNAIKYGAWSAGDGRIEIDWSIEASTGLVSLSWRETGGPAPDPQRVSPKTGFGSRMIDMCVRQLGATSETDFTASGLVFRLTFPAPA